MPSSSTSAVHTTGTAPPPACTRGPRSGVCINCLEKTCHRKTHFGPRAGVLLRRSHIREPCLSSRHRSRIPLHLSATDPLPILNPAKPASRREPETPLTTLRLQQPIPQLLFRLGRPRPVIPPSSPLSGTLPTSLSTPIPTTSPFPSVFVVKPKPDAYSFPRSFTFLRFHPCTNVYCKPHPEKGWLRSYRVSHSHYSDQRLGLMVS